jgi:uncharacterized LabA/DUF88 family protein
MKIYVYIDISNLYLCLNLKYQSKLNYKRYLDYIKGFGDIKQAKAYGAQNLNEARAFINHLKSLGVKTFYKQPTTYYNSGSPRTKADQDIKIAIDIIEDMANYDILVLGSADGDFEPLIQYIKKRKKKVYIVACDISHKLKKVADLCSEIPKTFMEEK